MLLSVNLFAAFGDFHGRHLLRGGVSLPNTHEETLTIDRWGRVAYDRWVRVDVGCEGK